MELSLNEVDFVGGLKRLEIVAHDQHGVQQQPPIDWLRERAPCIISHGWHPVRATVNMAFRDKAEAAIKEWDATHRK